MPLLLLALAACAAPLPIPVSAPIPDASFHDIKVVTTQTRDPNDPALFGGERSDVLNYGSVTVSIPPVHETGSIEWPGRNPDARQHFVVTDAEQYPDFRAFDRALPRAPETIVFVHGYNTTVLEAAFHLAQIREDFELDVPSVLFAWPSAGDVRGYLYDRDSVLFSRLDLAQTIRDLSRRGDVLIVAHSMGSLLAMEAMRHLAVTGDRRTLSKISAVTLVAPDIDKDVFVRQAKDIGTLPDPFLVFVAQTDRALRLSSFLTGREERLGNLSSAEDIGDLPIAIFDLTSLGSDAGLNHQVALESPAAIQLLKQVTDAGPEALGLLAPFLVNQSTQQRAAAGR